MCIRDRAQIAHEDVPAPDDEPASAPVEDPPSTPVGEEQAPEPAFVGPGAPKQNSRTRGPFGRRASREEGACSACRTPKPSGKPAELAQLGWVERDEVSLCPDCQASGWKLPEGASVPSRGRADRP